MPFYHAIVRPELLSDEQRQRFAQEVVDVHCGVTGAPPSFVHVLITEDDRGRLEQGRNASINGTIRSGRTPAQKDEIATRLSQALAGLAAVDPGTVETRTRDIEASFTMEGGSLLPEPGTPEEEAWKAS